MEPVTLVILLDKSAFESLSRREHRLFSYYFHFQVVPLVLLVEIMNDLVKEDASASSPEDLVQRLARKFGGSGPPVHVNHDGLLRNDLLGDPVVMDGRMYPDAARMVTDSVHGTGMVIDVSRPNELLLKWSYGDFSEGEKDMAAQVRTVLAEDERWKEHLDRKRGWRAKSMDEVGSLVNEALSDPADGSYWLGLLCERAQLREKDRVNVFDRWLRERKSLQAFTPYGHHCMKAELAYMVAADSRLLPESPSDMIDVEYLYYTPFCNVFVSKDRVHARLAPLLLRPDQEFVTGDALKADLRERHEESQALDEAARKRRQFAFGMYPVPRRGSIITRLYLKYAGMWPGSGNRAVKLSAEDKQLAIKEARKLFLRAGVEIVQRAAATDP